MTATSAGLLRALTEDIWLVEAPVRIIGAAGFRDRRAASRNIDAVLSLPIERIVVGHGSPIVENARESLADAYAWLGTGPIIGRR